MISYKSIGHHIPPSGIHGHAPATSSATSWVLLSSFMTSGKEWHDDVSLGSAELMRRPGTDAGERNKVCIGPAFVRKRYRRYANESEPGQSTYASELPVSAFETNKVA